MTAAWHLIAGSTGAGKTTYARRLAGELSGVTFSIDDWMTSLFWPDCPEMNDLPWALERVRRCEDQAAAVGAQLVQRGVPAIFDMGLTSRMLRERWMQRATAAGAPVVLHVLDLPQETRWERVQARNAARADTFAFPITPEMFATVEAMWERPTENRVRPVPGSGVVRWTLAGPCWKLGCPDMDRTPPEHIQQKNEFPSERHRLPSKP